MDIAVFKEAQEAYARGDYRVALVGFTACTSDVAELSSAEVGKFFHLIGNCYIKSGEPAKAAEFYGKALELASEQRKPALLVNLGTAYLSSEEYDKALDTFAKALSCEDYATPYKALSGIGAVQLKLDNPEAAGSAYREAALDPSNPTPGKALVNLGICFMELDRAADAISTYETALDCGLRPADANKCHANLGQALLSQGRVGEAVEAFKAATADGTYKMSTVAAHDMAMAMSLLERFGSVLSVDEPATQPAAPALQEPAVDESEPAVEQEAPIESEPELESTQLMEPLSEQPAEGDVPAEATESEEEAAEEQPAAIDLDAMWEPSPMPAVDAEAADEAAEDSADEAETVEHDEEFANASTQVFPVVSAPVAEGADSDATVAPPALDEDLPTDAFKAIDEDEEALIPSPEDTAFFTIKEEDIENAAKQERRKARKGHAGLKVALGVVIVLILLAAAAAAAYVLGYGYPLQEKVAQDFLNATVSEQSTDAYWNSSVTQESRDAQMAVLKDVSTYEVIAVERNTSNSLVYVKTALKDGGTAYYQLMMGRDLIGWDVEYVELYFPSEH